MNKKMSIVGIVFLTLFICLAVIAWRYRADPVKKSEEMLQAGDISTLVQYYNRHVEKMGEEEKSEIDELLTDYIHKPLIDWDVTDEEYYLVNCRLNELSKISNDQIATLAEENLSFIVCEYEGNQLLAEAEECYRQEQYLDAMQYLEQADPAYSQYSLFETLYEDSKLVLLQEVGHPATITEYETAIGTLKKYLEKVDDSDFELALTAFESELEAYKDIYDILTTATELYEEGDFKSSFQALETGLKKYPNNKKIQYALSSYQYAYLITVCCDVIDLIDVKEYEAAETAINIAIENYDCEEFQDLAKEIQMKTDILFAFKTYLKEAGGYIFKSSKKMVLGDFAEDEQETLLSLGGSVVASLLNFDAPLDVRDLGYDIRHWGEGDYFAAHLALDAVGVLPLIGAVKYVKHLDTVGDVAKEVDKTADAIDSVHDIAKAADTASDMAEGADLLLDTADVISDVKKKTDTVADLTDDFSDYVNQRNVIDDIIDTLKNTEKLDDAVDVSKKADTTGDVAESAVRHYEPIKTLNQHLVGEKHSVTGIEFVRNNLDLSDGRRLTGAFPKFDSCVDIQLPKEYFKKSFDTQKKYLADTLKEIAGTPAGRKQLEKFFDADQIQDILDGIIPEGYVWHHNEAEGLMQLVDEEIHNATNHTGGMSIWGIGH